jgi:hypothetical protein
MVVISRLGSTCKSMVFWTILGSIEFNEMEKQNKDIGA